MNLADAAVEMTRLSRLLDAGISQLRQQAHDLAHAEAHYRKAKAEAWVLCPNDPHDVRSGEREWTAARREAWVNAETAELRRVRDIAEGMRLAALEAVRSRRTQISALQSLLKAHEAEAEFERTRAA